MNEDEDGVESMNISNHSNILGDLLGNGDDLGPASLHNIAIPIYTFEVIVHVLNTSKKGIDDANSEIKELQYTPSAIENPQVNDESGDEYIPDHIMTQNKTTPTFQQYTLVARRGAFVYMDKTQHVWARASPTVFCTIFSSGKWVIHHAISGYHEVRDLHVLFDSWIKY